MLEVIKWDDYSGKENDIVWKHPSQSVKWGAALIVNEYENAAFFRDGKLYSVFGAGRHVLTTANFPVLSRLVRIHDEPSFITTIIFISNKKFTGKFGVRSQTTEFFPIIANGQYWYKVTDPTLFVNEVVGGNRRFTTEEVEDFLRSFLNQEIIKEFAAYDLATAFTQGIETISLKTKAVIFDKFENFGLDLFDFKFNTLDTEADYRELIALIKQGIPAAEVLRMRTIRQSAAELGKSTGGAAVGAGFILPQMVAQMPLSQPAPTPDKKEDPIQALKMRYANGEISDEEYQKRKKILEE
jgi:membrane protease subunit (stomatin/prohibitin family)